MHVRRLSVMCRSDDTASVLSTRSRTLPPKHSPPRQIVRLNHSAVVGHPRPLRSGRSPARHSRGPLRKAVGSLLATCGVIVTAGAATAALIAGFSVVSPSQSLPADHFFAATFCRKSIANVCKMLSLRAKNLARGLASGILLAKGFVRPISWHLGHAWGLHPGQFVIVPKIW